MRDQVTKQKNIQIYDSRAVGDQTLAAHFFFDSLQAGEELAREKRGLRFHDLIQEPWLIEHLARRGFIERRSTREVEMRRLHFLAGLPQIFGALPKV